jgi:hypothetical protein
LTLKNSAAKRPLFAGSHHLDRRAFDLIEAAQAEGDEDLMSTPMVAVWLGVSPEWLEIGRSRGWGPPFLRLSPRRVRYRRGTVKGWLKERAYRCTAEYADPREPRGDRKPSQRKAGAPGNAAPNA